MFNLSVRERLEQLSQTYLLEVSHALMLLPPHLSHPAKHSDLSIIHQFCSRSVSTGERIDEIAYLFWKNHDSESSMKDEIGKSPQHLVNSRSS